MNVQYVVIEFTRYWLLVSWTVWCVRWRRACNFYRQIKPLFFVLTLTLRNRLWAQNTESKTANASCLICRKMAVFAVERYCWHRRGYWLPAWLLCYMFWLSYCVPCVWTPGIAVSRIAIWISFRFRSWRGSQIGLSGSFRLSRTCSTTSMKVYWLVVSRSQIHYESTKERIRGKC